MPPKGTRDGIIPSRGTPQPPITSPKEKPQEDATVIRDGWELRLVKKIGGKGKEERRCYGVFCVFKDDDGLWCLYHLPSGKWVVAFSDYVQACQLAEELFDGYVLGFRHDDPLMVITKLPPWVPYWVKACRIAGKIVPKEPMSQWPTERKVEVEEDND